MMQGSVKKLLGEIKSEGPVTQSSSSGSHNNNSSINTKTGDSFNRDMAASTPYIKPVTAILSSTKEKGMVRVRTAKPSAAIGSTQMRKGWLPGNNMKIGGIENEVIDGWGTVQASIARKFDYFSGEGSKRGLVERALGEPKEYFSYVPGTVVIPPLPTSMNIAQKSGNIILAEPRVLGSDITSTSNFVPRLATRKF